MLHPTKLGLQIENYCEAVSSKILPLCHEIERVTHETQAMPQMLVGKLQGSLLRFLVGLARAKRILEIGTFTGYSALAMAENLPEDGELITIDINPETTRLAQSFWDKTPVGKKIHAKTGSALAVLPQLVGTFDLVFIDADKTSYLKYLQAALDKLSPNGLIVADNCLWSGRVLDPEQTEADTMALREFNLWVSQNQKLEKILLPIRDGLFLIKKISG